MIVKIFKTIGPRTYFTSISLIISTVSLSFFLSKNEPTLLVNIDYIISNVILMVAIISMMTILGTQIKGRQLAGIHMIAFPTAFLFSPYAFDLKFTSILQVILLVYGQFVFINLRHSKNTQKSILDLSIIISLLTQFNNLFLIFYLLPILILFQKGLKDIKHILALLLPTFIIPYTFASLSGILPPEIFELINPPLQIKLMSIQTLFYGDIIWLAFLLTSFMICTIRQWKGNKKFSYPQLFSNFLYMVIWLFFSIVYERLGQETPSERWFISFVPGAYFFGGFLESIKSDSFKNILFTILFLGILLFKLFDYGIISLQLPFLY